MAERFNQTLLELARCYIPFSPLSVPVPLSLFHSILSLLFQQVPFFPFHPYFLFPFTLLSVPALYYFPFPSSYYFPFLLYFCSPLLPLVAWYQYHEHCLSLITFDHVLLTLLDNLSPCLLPIPHIILIPLICLSIPLSI